MKRPALQNNGSEFYKWLFRPEKFSGLSRTRPQGPISSKAGKSASIVPLSKESPVSSMNQLQPFSVTDIIGMHNLC